MTLIGVGRASDEVNECAPRQTRFVLHVCAALLFSWQVSTSSQSFCFKGSMQESLNKPWTQITREKNPHTKCKINNRRQFRCSCIIVLLNLWCNSELPSTSIRHYFLASQAIITTCNYQRRTKPFHTSWGSGMTNSGSQQPASILIAHVKNPHLHIILVEFAVFGKPCLNRVICTRGNQDRLVIQKCGMYNWAIIVHFRNIKQSSFSQIPQYYLSLRGSSTHQWLCIWM